MRRPPIKKTHPSWDSIKYWKRYTNPLTNDITYYNERLNKTIIVKGREDIPNATLEEINRKNNEGRNMSTPWKEINKKSSRKKSSNKGSGKDLRAPGRGPIGMTFNEAQRVLKSALEKRIEAWQNSNKKDTDRVTDMTESVIRGFATSKIYDTQYEINLARYAVTKIVTKYGTFARDMKNVEQDPGKETIPTEFGKQTVVFGDVLSHLLIEVNGEKKNAMLQAVYIPCDRAYRVSIGGESNEAVKALENLYEQTIETNNFYQGKTLRFAADGVTFVQTPETILEDAILPQKTLDEYDMNVVSFLTEPEMFAITKKRSILLFGPPGTGKTTSVQALFNILAKRDVSCIFISDESFRKFSVEDVFGFINKYLAPALVVFEDIDLIAQDRKMGASKIIGPLLSALNGIESQEKPIVIIGTTNRAEILDEAVTRPCRFDRKIKVDYPTDDALRTMFKKRAGFEAPLEAIKQSDKNNGKLTGAHIEEIYNTAALTAQKQGRKVEDCVSEAVEIVKENFFVAQPSGMGFVTPDYDRDEDCGMEVACPSSPGENPDDGDFFR
ncbi:MAG: AAA family ATPase [Candidatus Cloacimonetes bacterium]|jgi:predicted AAA+ superfamily ATPase|nr:AAA family ATPase [Candidatus Cloacimonadota bacterium]